MLQRDANFAGGMKDIGAQNEIEGADLKALFGSRLFEIEDFELDLGKSRQLLHGSGKECRGHVAESIGVKPTLEQGQHERCQPSRASAHLEDAQPAALRKVSSHFVHGGSYRGKPLACEKSITIELIQQLRSRSRKEDLNRLFFTTQQGAEFGAVRSAEQALR